MRAHIALFLLTSPLWAQSSRDQGRRADLNVIATEIPKAHPNFFFQLNPADFNQAVQALDAQVPNLSDAEFYVGLAKLVALAGDEHTSLSLSGPAAANAGFQQFPLQFRWLDDGVFVTGASSEYSRALGSRLVGVGDSSIESVVRQLATVIPHSNSQWVHYMAQSYLRGQQILQGLDIVPAGSTTRLTFRTLAGEDFTLDVVASAAPMVSAPSPDQGPLPEYLQRSNENYWFTYSAPRRLLYFKYNQCAQTPGNPFAAFSDNLLRVFDANAVDTLVFDFRGNTGGDAGLFEPLINGFVARIPVFLANPSFRIYAVIDKGTFSSALDDAMSFKTPASAYAAMFPAFDPTRIIRVIGEPTGGAPAHYGSVLPFTLPSSKLTGQFSTVYLDAPPFITPDTDPDGPSFGPDIAVPLRASDFFARHDPVLAAILARFEGAPPVPAGSAIALNGASLRVEQGLAPASFASAFGTFPDGIDGIQINGETGLVISASSSRVDFVVPPTASVGPAAISVRMGANDVASGTATITLAGPGIFVLQSTDPAQPGNVLNQDGSVNSPSNRAASGSVVQIFATGYGPLDSSRQAPVRVLFGGTPANVLFSGPVEQTPGLWQINAGLPDGVSGQVPLFLIAGSTASNGVTLWVQ